MWFSTDFDSPPNSGFPLGIWPPFNFGLNALMRNMVDQAAGVNRTPEFVPFSINKPVISLRNTENNNNRERNCYDILQKLVSLAIFDSGKNTYIPIIEKFMIGDLQQRDVLDLILDILEIFQDDCPNKLDFLEKQFSQLLLPKELLAISTLEENIESLWHIATGGFGDIFEGKFIQANGIVSNVIIKCSVQRDKNRFLKNEALTMSKLQHENIVKIMAFVQSPMMIIMENIDNGDLRHYLEVNKASEAQLYKMIIDILTGMVYFSGKLYIHRDLAARNIFINSKLQCKIGDFGLACQIKEPNGIYKEESGRLDMYSTPPDASYKQEFSIKSDVWAMGVLIWEIFYLKVHSEGHAYSQLPVQLYLNNFHHTLELPFTGICPETLSEYIEWHILVGDPEKRPTFTNIKEFISTNFIDN